MDLIKRLNLLELQVWTCNVAQNRPKSEENKSRAGTASDADAKHWRDVGE